MKIEPFKSHCRWNPHEERVRWAGSERRVPGGGDGATGDGEEARKQNRQGESDKQPDNFFAASRRKPPQGKNRKYKKLLAEACGEKKNEKTCSRRLAEACGAENM